jgi:hypothetical protein
MSSIRNAMLAWLLGIVSLPAQTPAALDTIFLSSGERRAARVTAMDAQGFSVEVTLVAGQPPATIRVPRASVAQIEFAPDEARDTFLARATTAQLASVAALWARWEPFLALPRAPSARIGLRYGALLFESGKTTEALALFQKIESGAWREEDRAAVRPWRLRTLVAAGREEEAVQEARTLAETATEPGALIEAKFLLATVADRQLRRLVADNPRWEEDDRVRPERHRLYHEAVDLYLYPSLFHGSRSETAARGLGQLVALYRFTGELQLALETARDLTAFYAETAPAKSAGTWMTSLTADEKKIDWEKEAKATFGQTAASKMTPPQTETKKTTTKKKKP